MFKRVKITKDNVNLLMKDGTITPDEQKEFFINFCYKTMIPEKLRKECYLHNLISHGVEQKINVDRLTAKQAQEMATYLLNAEQAATTLSNALMKNMRMVNNNRQEITEDFVLRSFEKALTFDEIAAILRFEMVEAQQGALIGSLYADDMTESFLKRSLQKALDSLTRALSANSSVYAMTIGYFGARI